MDISFGKYRKCTIALWQYLHTTRDDVLCLFRRDKNIINFISFHQLHVPFVLPIISRAILLQHLHRLSATTMTSSSLQNDKVAVLVTVDIQPEREAEFLDIMHKDAEESRKEEGCDCFHLLKVEGKECTYSRLLCFSLVYNVRNLVCRVSVPKIKDNVHFYRYCPPIRTCSIFLDRCLRFRQSRTPSKIRLLRGLQERGSALLTQVSTRFTRTWKRRKLTRHCRTIWPGQSLRSGEVCSIRLSCPMQGWMWRSRGRGVLVQKNLIHPRMKICIVCV